MIVNKTKVKSLITFFFMLTGLIGAFKPHAEAASAADFYKDKKITFIIGDAAGAGSDSLVRIIAPYLKKYTGAYAVVIVNVPDAGGMVALNRIHRAKPDGLTISTLIPSITVMMEASKAEGIQFQTDKFPVLWGLTSEVGNILTVSSKGPYRTVEDLKKAKGLKSAGKYGPAITGAFFADVLGLDAKITPGMDQSASRLALLRGETDYFPESPGGAVDRIKSGEVLGLCVNQTKSISVLPQVPPVTKFASLSPAQHKWIEIMELNDSGKYVITPPKAPKDRIEYLRNIFARMHKDPQFLKDRKKFERWPGGEPWLNGTEAQEKLRTYAHKANEGFGQMTEYLSKKYFTVR